MKKAIRFLMALLVGIFPIQQQVIHGTGQCCAECAMKREEEVKIEYIEEQNTEA